LGSGLGRRAVRGKENHFAVVLPTRMALKGKKDRPANGRRGEKGGRRNTFVRHSPISAKAGREEEGYSRIKDLFTFSNPTSDQRSALKEKKKKKKKKKKSPQTHSPVIEESLCLYRPRGRRKEGGGGRSRLIENLEAGSKTGGEERRL